MHKGCNNIWGKNEMNGGYLKKVTEGNLGAIIQLDESLITDVVF
jgi:hypothetical protein